MGAVARRVGVGLLALAMVAGAAVGFGLVTGGMGAEALGAELESWNNELKEQANSAATRAKLFDRLKAAREKLMPIKDTATATLGRLNGRLEQMTGEHEGPPAGWPAEHRAEYERTLDARDRLVRAQSGLDSAWENLKWLQARQNVEGFDPFRNEQFKQRFAELGTQVSQVAAEFGEFNATYNVETADRTNENSPVVVVLASRVHARNTSEGMMFVVNGETLEPGNHTAEIRLGDHRGLVVRAVGFDDKRRQIRRLQDQLEHGTGQARLLNIDAAARYTISYGTDQLTTTLTAKSERYSWSWGTNVTRAIGQRSPWSAGGPVIVEPELSDSADNRVHDTVTWWVPAVEDAVVTFGLTANGQVVWQTQRKRGGTVVADDEDTLLSDGMLEVIVGAR